MSESHDTHGTLLEQVLARALELHEQGLPVDVAALCAECPQLVPSVTAALQRVPHLPGMHLETTLADAFLGRLLARRYRLDERIGSGAMGVVYRAYDLALDREVAIKVLRPELVVGERMDARLLREGQVLAGIRHQNVVSVYDRGTAEDGRSFLVMELLRGHNASRVLRGLSDTPGETITSSARMAELRRLLGEGVIVADGDVRQVVRWIIAAAEGLHAAHQSGVVHRDVKPSNLFLERGGRVVLLDFGIVSSGAHATLGSDGSPFGTPAYMAPEQVQAGAEPDVRSDVYSLTATLYHLLTGRPPFEGSVQQVLAAIQSREPLPAERARPGLPIDLAAIVEKGMAKDPAQRYPSAQALRDELMAWLEYRPITARRASRWQSAWRRARRSPQVRTAVGVLLAVAVALGAWQWSVVRAEGRDRRELELWAQVPPSLVSGPREYRVGSALRHSTRVHDLLDELVGLDSGTGIALALRAMHRSDGGDLAGAADDLEVLAARGNAPFATVAAAAYRRGELPDVMTQGEEAPAAGGIGDRFAVSLHAMRSRAPRPMWIGQLLRQEQAPDRYPGFAELELMFEQGNAEAIRAFEPKLAAFDHLAEQARRLETLRARPIAIAHLVQVNALRMRASSAAARELAVEAQHLAPDCFVLPLVEASSALHAADWDAATHACRRSIELQPASLNAHDWLVRSLIGADSYAEADLELRAAAFAVVPDGVARRQELEGLMFFRRALAAAMHEQEAADRGEVPATESPSESPAESLARRARESFRSAREAAGQDQPVSLEELLCGDLLGEPSACAEILSLLAERPLDAELIAHVATFLPESLGPGDVDALARLLQQQAAAIGVRSR